MTENRILQGKTPISDYREWWLEECVEGLVLKCKKPQHDEHNQMAANSILLITEDHIEMCGGVDIIYGLQLEDSRGRNFIVVRYPEGESDAK